MNQPSDIEISSIPGQPVLPAARPEPCTLVIFGGTGDLTHRKLMPSLYNLMADDALPDPVRIVGVGRRELTPDAFREGLRESTVAHSREAVDPAVWDRFADRISYVRAGTDDANSYARLKAALEELERADGTNGNRIFYLATPPSLVPVIVPHLHASGLVTPGARRPWSRVIVEKPFGRDLASARELNRLLGESLTEEQLFRIDHYLGKETVQNILVFRFGNAVFEPLWNRKYIDYVEITAAETIGVEGRGAFYDTTGVLRDIVQNHLLQVLALCAMEPPVSFAADDIRDEKSQLLRSLRPLGAADLGESVVLAQYRGYREEPEVAPTSRTPTYTAMKVMIDNWRWHDVPFYIRAGKGLKARVTEVSFHLQPVPLCLFPHEDACQRLQPNVLKLRIQPEEGVSLHFVAKVPGEHVSVADVAMNMTYDKAFAVPLADAYERLLLDAMRGDATLFARRDEVEHAWAFVTPILEAWESDPARDVAFYDRGTPGPPEARQLVAWTGL
jgi:glucose-6-phosphate 1-dehydrogenase